MPSDQRHAAASAATQRSGRLKSTAAAQRAGAILGLATLSIACLAVLGCRQQSTSVGHAAAANPAGANAEASIVAALRHKHADVRYSAGDPQGATVQVDLSLVDDVAGSLYLATQLAHVERLNLHGLALRPEDFALLNKFPKVRWLDLSQTPVTDGELKNLIETPHVEFLLLWGTEISDAGLPRLAPLKYLRKLDLSGTKVTAAGLTALKSLTTLQELHVETPGVNDASIKALKPALPETLLVY